jgi:hypothetical protein
MNSILDESMVGLVLLVSAGYLVASLGPKALKSRMLDSLSRLMAGAPALLGLGRIAQRLAAAAQKASGGSGACGGCDNCGANTQTTRTSAEFKVPVEKIGRRPG